MGRVLFRMIHISDLHIAETDNVLRGDPSQVSKLDTPFLKGFRTHDPNVIRELAEFITRMREDDPNVCVMMTGDLTANGSAEEFNRAIAFLCSNNPEVPFLWTSMHYNGWASWSVPGNHDHWAGNPWNWKRREETHVKDVFNNVPFNNMLWHLDDELSIRFLGINTDADTGIVSRVLARGAFTSQLEQLTKRMRLLDAQLSERKKAREIRVMLLHHPYSYVARASTLYSRAVDEDSKQQLRSFLNEFNISVLCSGHIHIPRVQILDIPHNGVIRNVIEAICGTSAQYTHGRSSSLQRARTLAGGISRNTLLMHSVVEDGGKIFWKVETYVYAGPWKLFKPLHSSTVADLSGSFKVWP